MSSQMTIKASLVNVALQTANGETLSQKIKNIKTTNVEAVMTNREFEVLIFTDEQSCSEFGGFLAGERIIDPQGKKAQ